MIKYFFSIFCIFLKHRRLWPRFQCRNKFCMQKYPNKGIFIRFAESSHFSENFRRGYSMAFFMLSAKKLIYSNLAMFGFFPSKKHDSFGFMKFCLKLVEKITKKQKIMITNFFFFLVISCYCPTTKLFVFRPRSLRWSRGACPPVQATASQGGPWGLPPGLQVHGVQGGVRGLPRFGRLGQVVRLGL